MKKSAQINGLPIISIMDGNQVGKVKSLVINPDKGSVDFLTIEHEDFQVSVKAIPFKKVVGIGEYAVTVDSESAIIDLNEIPIANQLVNKKIKITNTKVMTRKGQLLGEVLEYLVDDDSGHIIGLELRVDNQETVLNSEAVVTFGKDIIIVKEDAASSYLSGVEELDKKTDILLEEEQLLEEVAPAAAPVEEVEKYELLSLKQKQLDLLKGKTITNNIMGLNGEVLFYKGRVLSEDDIKRAQNESASVIVEMSMNVEL